MKLKLRPGPSPITTADRARDAGHWQVAAEHYFKALKRNPEKAPIWVQYGHALKEMGKLREAERAYQRAIACEVADGDAWLHLGHVLKLQSQADEAVAAYLKAFALAPQSQGVITELSRSGLLDEELAELYALAAEFDASIGMAARRQRPQAPKRLNSAPAFRLVYVSGESHTPGHTYRVLRPMRAAVQAGAEVGWMQPSEILDRRGELAAADAVIFWRTVWDEQIALGIKIARSNGAKVIFDIDDLLIDPSLAKIEVIDGIRSHRFHESTVQAEFSQLRATLLASDLCLATTEELAGHIRDAGRPAVVLQNGFDHSTLRLARLAARRRALEPEDGLVRIGYATGSMTHQRDFAQCAAAVASTLRERPECRLVAFRRSEDARPILHIEEFDCLRGLEDQIDWRTYVPLGRLPDELARFDINLAPLEVGNPFCEAKSELKFFEAALAGVVSVASATGPFRRAIRHHETGFLAATADEWHHHLSALVEDSALRDRTAKAAYRDVLWQFGPERRAETMAAIIDLLKRASGGAHTANGETCAINGTALVDPFIPEHDTVFSSDRLIGAEITVVVSLHNSAAFIDEVLSSVAAQELANLDLVVVDDCSTDGSLAVALQWAKSHVARFGRICILKTAASSGVAANRNLGFDQADTAFVLPLDVEDRLLPDCLAACLEAIANSGAAFVYSAIRQVDDDDRPTDGDRSALVAKAAWSRAGGYDCLGPGTARDLCVKLAEFGLWGAQLPGGPYVETRAAAALGVTNSQVISRPEISVAARSR